MIVNGVFMPASVAVELCSHLLAARSSARVDGLPLSDAANAVVDECQQLERRHMAARTEPTLRLSTSEAAAILGVSQRQVTAYLANRRLHGRKPHGVWQIDAASVRELAVWRRGDQIAA